jgi:hypothetical protein
MIENFTEEQMISAAKADIQQAVSKVPSRNLKVRLGSISDVQDHITQGARCGHFQPFI